MTLAVGLLVAMFVIGFGAPTYLQVTVAPGLHPRLALAAWTTSVALLLVALVAAPLALALHPGREVFGAAHACLATLRKSRELPWLDAVEVVLMVAATGLALYVAAVTARRLRADRRWRADHLRAIRAIARSDRPTSPDCGPEVLWIDSAVPASYSVGGRRGAIILSRPIAELSPSALAAVVEHERAHLRGRHHLLVLATEAIAAALPFIPLCRQAPGAVRALVEFAADHRAAERCGSAVVGQALLAAHAGAAPPHAPAPSAESVAARLCWLGTPPNPRQRLCGPVDYPVAVAVATAPLAVSVLAMGLLAMSVCLLLGA